MFRKTFILLQILIIFAKAAPNIVHLRENYCEEFQSLNKNITNCTNHKTDHGFYITTEFITIKYDFGDLMIECFNNSYTQIFFAKISVDELHTIKLKGVYLENCFNSGLTSLKLLKELGVDEITLFSNLYSKNEKPLYYLTQNNVVPSMLSKAVKINVYDYISSLKISGYEHATFIQLEVYTETLPANLFNNFPNVEHIYLTSYLGYILNTEIISHLKHLLSLTYEYSPKNDKYNNESEWKQMRFNNMSHLRELRLRNVFLANCTFSLSEEFLDGNQNLELFELTGQRLNVPNIILLPNIFRGLRKLRILILNNLMYDRDTLWSPMQNLNNLYFWNMKPSDFLVNQSHFDVNLFNVLPKQLEYITTNSYLGNNTFEKFTNLKIFMTDATYFGNKKFFICYTKTSHQYNCNFYLDDNEIPCPDVCKCWLEFNSMRFMIDCSHGLLEQLPNSLPIPRTGNKTLLFSHNQLSVLTKLSYYGYSNLKELHLDDNKLTKLGVEIPSNITYLDISNNSLTTLDENEIYELSKRIRNNKLRLRLSGNPWHCNCDLKPFVVFIKDFKKYILDAQEMQCSYDSFPDRKHILDLQDKDICVPLSTYVIGLLLVIIIIAIGIIVVLLYKDTIQMWLYEHNWLLWLVSNAELEESKKFDAFLAYCHKDAEHCWEIVDRLENGERKFRICFYERDWLIGVPINKCICQSVQDSRRIIILLTNNFLKSAWGLLEFRLAIAATSNDKRKRLIVVVFPEVESDSLSDEMKSYMTLNTYVKRDDSFFWMKLIYAMPHTKGVVKVD